MISIVSFFCMNFFLCLWHSVAVFFVSLSLTSSTPNPPHIFPSFWKTQFILDLFNLILSAILFLSKVYNLKVICVDLRAPCKLKGRKCRPIKTFLPQGRYRHVGSLATPLVTQETGWSRLVKVRLEFFVIFVINGSGSQSVRQFVTFSSRAYFIGRFIKKIYKGVLNSGNCFLNHMIQTKDIELLPTPSPYDGLGTYIKIILFLMEKITQNTMEMGPTLFNATLGPFVDKYPAVLNIYLVP